MNTPTLYHVIRIWGITYLMTVFLVFTAMELVAWATTDTLLLTYNASGEKPFEMALAVIGVPCAIGVVASTLKESIIEMLNNMKKGA